MQEAVSDVLASRYQLTDHMSRTLTVSLGVHVVALAALFIVPRFLPHRPPPVVMTISLGGTPGPQVQGMTAASGRQVDEAVPQPKRPEPVPTATAKPADTTADAAVSVPKPRAVTPSPVAPPPKPAPDPRKYYAMNDNTPTSTKPITGKQVSAGTAQAETGVKGLGTGLASGGTGGITLDVDFCCPDYLQLVTDRIKEHWQDSATKATNVVKFTIEKNGLITGVEIEERSGHDELDMTSKRALLETPKLAPLPSGFSGPRLTVHLRVIYGGS